MTQLTCLDGDHELPADLAIAVAGVADPCRVLLDEHHCPACPDIELTAGRQGVQVCPCCWSVWWLEDGAVRCTPGAVVVEEPAPPRRHATA